ncbi:MAG: thrombospondin type 3 repeat-containing protein [Patescibacteria group bacterium]
MDVIKPVSDQSIAGSTPQNQSTQTAQQQTMNSPGMPEPKQKRSVVKAIILSLAGLIVLGGIAYGGWFGYQYFFGFDPETTLWKALRSVQFTDAMHVAGDIEVVMIEGVSEDASTLDVLGDIFLDTGKQTFTVALDTSYDKRDENNVLIDSSLSLGVNSEFTLDILMRFVEEVLYVQGSVGGTATLGFFELPEAWLAVDEESSNEFIEDFLKQDTDSISQNITADDVARILRENDAISFTVNDEVNTTLGYDAHEYIILFNREGLTTSIKQLIALVDDEDLRAKLEEEYEDPTDEEWEQFAQNKVMLLIDHMNEQLRLVSIEGKFVPEEPQDPTFRYSASFTFEPLQEPLSVEVPSETLNVDEYLDELFGGFMMGMESMEYEEGGGSSTFFEVTNIAAGIGSYYSLLGYYPQYDDGFWFDSEYILCEEGFVGFDTECDLEYAIVSYVDTVRPVRYISLPDDSYAILYYMNDSFGSADQGWNVAYPSTINGNPFTDHLTLEQYKNKFPEHEALVDGMAIFNSDPTNDFAAQDENRDEGSLLEDQLTLDSDNDGLIDNDEIFIYFTDPFDPDSDGDGYSDGVEVENGYDPNS